jgi:hypothetical protein
MPETCANCGAVIGKLETPHVFKDQIVCGACRTRLVAAVAPAPILPAVSNPAALPGVAATDKVLPMGWMICPNPHCGFQGMPLKEKKGSTLIMIVLLLLWILPGVIYAIVYNGNVLKCPRCKMTLGESKA